MTVFMPRYWAVWPTALVGPHAQMPLGGATRGAQRSLGACMGNWSIGYAAACREACRAFLNRCLPCISDSHEFMSVNSQERVLCICVPVLSVYVVTYVLVLV